METTITCFIYVYMGLRQGSIPSFLANQRPEKGAAEDPGELKG